MRVFGIVLGLLLAGSALAGGLDGRRLQVVDGRLLDQRGREVTLRGVNARVEGVFDVTFDDGRLPLEDIPTFDAGDVDRMRDLGFNLLRLPINWSALEPSAASTRRAYLDRIAAVVELCAKRGVLVLLDFHQDAFSKEIGQDGAPRWVLDLLLGPNGYPYLGGPITDLNARRLAPHTLEAFRRFDANEQGVQDLFAQAAAVVAKRFRRNRTVVGYEIMNEPLATPNALGEAQLLGAAHAGGGGHPPRRSPPSRGIRAEHAAELPEPGAAPVGAVPGREGGLRAAHLHLRVRRPDASPAIAPRSPRPCRTRRTRRPRGARRSSSASTASIRRIRSRTNGSRRRSTCRTCTARTRRSGSGRRSAPATGVSSTASRASPAASGSGGRRRCLGRTRRPCPGRVLAHTVDAATSRLRVEWEADARGPIEVYVPTRRFLNGVTVTCDGSLIDAAPDPDTHVLRARCGGRSGRHVLEVSAS